MRVLRKDIYAELTRRRRRAQIAARHERRESLDLAWGPGASAERPEASSLYGNTPMSM